MDDEEEEAVLVGDGPEPRHEPLDRVRVMPNGRSYRIPEKGKKVVCLEEDCGLILFDAEFFQQMPGFARTYMDEGNPIINAMWKQKNLIPFRRRWRPRFQLPKSSN
jgi:hypothetical protein